MDYRGVVPAIDAYVGRERSEAELRDFAHSSDGPVYVYSPDGALKCHMSWARNVIENLLDDNKDLRFDCIISPVSYLGGVMFPLAFEAVWKEMAKYRDFSVIYVDPNQKASWWHDRLLFLREGNTRVLVCFDQFMYPPSFTNKYLNPNDFLDKLSLAKVYIVATCGIKINPDIDHWGMGDSDVWFATLHPELNPGKGSQPAIVDYSTDPFLEYYLPTIEQMLNDHFMKNGKPNFELIASPSLPLNAAIVPYLIQRIMVKRGYKIPVERFETWFKEKDAPNNVRGKKVLIAHDAFYQTPTLRRHCPCCGNEYFNAPALSFDLQANLKADVVGMIGLFNYGHLNELATNAPIYPVVVLPSQE